MVWYDHIPLNANRETNYAGSKYQGCTIAPVPVHQITRMVGTTLLTCHLSPLLPPIAPWSCTIFAQPIAPPIAWWSCTTFAPITPNVTSSFALVTSNDNFALTDWLHCYAPSAWCCSKFSQCAPVISSNKSSLPIGRYGIHIMDRSIIKVQPLFLFFLTAQRPAQLRPTQATHTNQCDSHEVRIMRLTLPNPTWLLNSMQPNATYLI